MANRADNTATSTDVIPAGHAALTAEDERGEHQSDTSTGLAGLSVAALGVVFGDIGTSPVYTFRECFNPEHGFPLDAEHVLGVLSMIFWALILVVAVKYVLLVLPLTIVVLLALFLFQKGGTERVGRLFGPVMVLWFAVLAVSGVFQIAKAPGVLAALNPAYAVGIFLAAPGAGFVALGAVALAITGGEALYADMGHFGRFPIRLAWFALVLPALVLDYFGQGALILSDKSAIENPFFRRVPGWGLFPLVLLSTAATVIASQAVISGAFSLSRQAIQLGLMPPLDLFQTSTRARGQIYISQVNWLLLIAVLALVLGFQSSSALASAYGFAVTGTMTITMVLAGAVMRGVWRWQWPTVAVVLVPIMTVDLALFAANALKIPSGGWFPLVIGLVVFTIMTTWRAGRRLVATRLASEAVPLASFLATCEEAAEARVSGTAVFLTTQTALVPVTLLRNLKHNKVLHQTVLLVRVATENIPRVAGADRIKVRELGSGFWQIEAHFGFAQTPNVPRELGRAEIPGLEFDPSQLSFFVGRANVKSTSRPGMARWRERLYSALARVATRSTDFFRIPPDRVIELGAEVEI